MVLIFLVLAGATNGVNLTDGLDGLAAGCGAIVLLTYTAIAFITGGQDGLSITEQDGLVAAGRVPRRRVASASCGSTRSRPRSSWATRARSASAARSPGMAVMTKSEVLLIVIGGIFVIEALSVAAQVIAFRLFRRRVLLMAPIHHHFELLGLVGDEDHRAVLDHGRDLQRDRLHALPAEHRRVSRARPPLPPGPVPGRRARALRGGGGARAARRARPASGVVACDSRRARRRRSRRRERLAAGGRRSPPGYRWNRSLLQASPPPATRRQEPRGPVGRARRRARARERGIEVLGELELGWRLVPNEFIAVTGTNGKTTTVELIGAIHRAAGAARGGGRQRRHAGQLAGRARSTRTRRSCARRRASSSRTRSRSRPRRRCSSTSRADHLDRHATVDDYLRREAAHLRQPAAVRRRGR